MTQYSRENPIVAPQSGPDFAADVNEMLQVILTGNEGTTRPAGMAAGGLWSRDNGSGDVEVLLYNGVTDVVVYPLQGPRRLASFDMSGQTEFIFTGFDGLLYASYTVNISNVDQTMSVRTSTDGGTTFDSGATDYRFDREGGNPGSSTGTSSVTISSGLNDVPWSGKVMIPHPDGVGNTVIRGWTWGLDVGGPVRSDIVFDRNSVTAFDAIRFSVNVASTGGRITVIGNPF